MIEIWKDIKGFEGYYQVSNLGRIKRLPRYTCVIGRFGKRTYNVEEKIMEPFTWQSRYLRVDITYKRDRICHRRATYVHTLVAEAFIGDRPEGYVIDHINGDYLDNRAENLRYVTQTENANNPNNKPGMKGRRYNEEERQYISVKTTEAMKRPEVYAKLGSGTRGKHRKTTYDDKGNKIIRYVNDN